MTSGEGLGPADRAEDECISRFRQLCELGRLIDPAARRADASWRPENVLRFGSLTSAGEASASVRGSDGRTVRWRTRVA